MYIAVESGFSFLLVVLRAHIHGSSTNCLLFGIALVYYVYILR